MAGGKSKARLPPRGRQVVDDPRLRSATAQARVNCLDPPCSENSAGSALDPPLQSRRYRLEHGGDARARPVRTPLLARITYDCAGRRRRRVTALDRPYRHVRHQHCRLQPRRERARGRSTAGAGLRRARRRGSSLLPPAASDGSSRRRRTAIRLAQEGVKGLHALVVAGEEPAPRSFPAIPGLRHRRPPNAPPPRARSRAIEHQNTNLGSTFEIVPGARQLCSNSTNTKRAVKADAALAGYYIGMYALPDRRSVWALAPGAA